MNRGIPLFGLATALVVGLSSLSGGCAGNVSTEFPPGLEPLEPINQAPPPAPLNGDNYPEQISFRSSETDDYYSTHARAYIHAPISKVWEAYRTPEVVVDKDVEWSVDYNTEPQYNYKYVFTLHNTSHQVITIRWDTTFREDVVEGTLDDPQIVAIRFQKTHGTTYISHLAGSILLTKLNDSTTELQMIEHCKATGVSTGAMEQYFQKTFDMAVARVHSR